MARPGGLYTPLVRWAGSKSQVLADLLPHFPYRIGYYVEPFFGGGAVFWALKSGLRTAEARINDSNLDLMTFYRVLRDDNDAFMTEIARYGPLEMADEEARYYQVRGQDPDRLTDVARAARFLYLNKTSFNGVYRTNRKGQINIAFGKRQALFDHDAIRNAGPALAGVDIRCEDWRVALQDVPEGAVVYLDPPYWSLQKDSFVGYGASRFGVGDHEELAAWVRQAVRRHVTVVVSNSDCPDVRRLYAGLRFYELREKRKVSCTVEGRKAVGSLLIVADAGGVERRACP